MVIDPIVVERYAEALFGRALKEGQLEALAYEVSQLVPAMKGNDLLREFFESPNIRRSSKRDMIEKTLAQSESSQLDEFAHLLLDKGRISQFVPILERLLILEEEHRGLFNAEIVTACDLSADERAQMQATLDRHTGHQLDITFSVDPTILGGVIFRHRDEMIDTSLRGYLNEIGADLMDVRVH